LTLQHALNRWHRVVRTYGLDLRTVHTTLRNNHSETREMLKNETVQPTTTREDEFSGCFRAVISVFGPSGTILREMINPLTPNDHYSGRTAPLTSKVALYIFIQHIYVPNILNMVYTLRFFLSSKCSLFHNSNVFGSCIIHIL